MSERETDWKQMLKNLEHHLSNFLSGDKYLKQAGYQGIKSVISSNIEVEKAVWGTGPQGAFKRDEFRGFEERDAGDAAEFIKSKIAEQESK